MTATPTVWELIAGHFTPRQVPWTTPGELAAEFDPSNVQTPMMNLLDKELVQAYNTPDARLLITTPPQMGKSQRVSRRFPTWVLAKNPETRIVIASYETGVARRWGRVIRDDITEHGKPYGLQIRPDVSSQSEWQLAGHNGGVFTAGLGSALTGKPADLMIIDDPVKNRQEADSETYQTRNWEWWNDVAQTRLAPGAPVVLVMTRWSEKDLGGLLLDSVDGDNWRVVNVPAQAEHNDPLGREPGEWLTTTRGMTTEQWERRKKATDPRTWAALYQGNPTPGEGGLLPNDMPVYETPMWVEENDGTRTVPALTQPGTELIQSWDLAFKGDDTSDYVVGQIWLRRNGNAYLLDMFRGRVSFTRTRQAIKDMTAKWPQAAAKLIEDKANGPAIIDSLRNTVPGIIPVNPAGGKEQRATAVSPFMFSGNVHLPDAKLLPNVTALYEEIYAFPTGANDDTIDAMTQALNQLFLKPLQQPDYGDDDLNDLFDYRISDY